VDVGANVGYLTLIMARHARRVYAFEPDPRSRAILKYNIRENDYDNVVVRPEAAFDHNGRARFYQNIETALSGLVPHDGIASTIQVETVKLDSIIRRASLIKVDVEGADAAVLKGMSRLLSECPRLRLIIEVEPDRPNAMLGIFDILEGWNTRNLDRLNVLFWRDPE
jgi:FkbM family methyltransferase